MRSCGASHWLRMSQSEAEDEQLLGGIQEGDDPMDEGSEHGSESEDESDDANAGKTKLKHKVEVLRTQLEARTAQADAAISKNRVIVAKCEGLQNAFKQEKDMKEALQYDCNRLEAENTELKTQMAVKDESIAVLSRTIGEQQDRITELTGQVGMYKECITRIDDARTHLALQHSGGQRRHSDGGGGKQQQHGNKGHPGAGTSKAGSGSGGKEAAGSGSKGSAGSGSSKGAVAGQKRPYRSDAVFTYCKKNGMCLNCYGKHKASTCTAQEAEGFPPGYSAE